MTDRVHDILAELRRELATTYGARLRKTVLFGSQARGDAAPDSDIDVLVVLDGPVDPGAEVERCSGMLSTLSLAHDTVLHAAFAAADRYETERSPLLINVRREGVALLPQCL